MNTQKAIEVLKQAGYKVSATKTKGKVLSVPTVVENALKQKIALRGDDYYTGDIKAVGKNLYALKTKHGWRPVFRFTDNNKLVVNKLFAFNGRKLVKR
jgi:hypothetical protein